MTLGHLHVGDDGKDDRRKSHHRDESEPIHKGRRYTSPGPFRQLPTRHISIGFGRIKDLPNRSVAGRKSRRSQTRCHFEHHVIIRVAQRTPLPGLTSHFDQGSVDAEEGVIGLVMFAQSAAGLPDIAEDAC